MKMITKIAALSLVVIVAGCSSPKQDDNSVLVNQAAMNKDSNQYGQLGSLADKIKAEGVNVEMAGQTLRLVVPVDDFFVAGSRSEVKSSKLATLAQVVELTRYYSNRAPVHVIGYTTNVVGSAKDQLADSKAWAEAIASYLWNDGLAKSRMKIQGKGAVNPIASNETPAGASMNRRVEISVLLPK